MAGTVTLGRAGVSAVTELGTVTVSPLVVGVPITLDKGNVSIPRAKAVAIAAAIDANKPKASGDGSSAAQKTGKGADASLSVATRIDHVLSVYQNGDWLRSIPLPNQPSSIDVSKTPAVSLRRTLGRLPIRQHSQDRVWDMTFQGMVGIANRPYRTAAGDNQSMQGLEILNQFDAFLAAYQELASTAESLYLSVPDNASLLDNRTVLVYSDFQLGISYLVEQSHFVYNRGMMTRVGNASWSLRLQVYGIHNAGQTAKTAGDYSRSLPSTTPLPLQNPLKIKLKAGLDAGRFTSIRAFGILSSGGAEGVLTSPLDAYVSALGAPSASSVLSPAVLREIKKLRGHVSSFNEATRRLRLRIQEVKNVVQLPFTVVSDVVNSGNRVLGVLNDVRDSGYHFMEDYSHLGSALKQLALFTEGSVAATTSLFGAIGGNYRYLRKGDLDSTYNSPMSGVGIGAASAISQYDDLSRYANTGTYKVAQGETWATIALKHFGSVDAWLFLASYNNAADAYSLSDGSPLAAGATIYLPGGTNTGTMAAPVSSTDLYGTCLAFNFQTGDLVLADSPGISSSGGALQQVSPDSRTSFARATGTNNFRQSLTHRMLTVRGELAYDPGYGIFASAPGDPIDARTLVSGAAEIAAQLRRDPRVSAVTDVSLSMKADSLTAQFSVTGIGGSKVSVVAPVS